MSHFAIIGAKVHAKRNSSSKPVKELLESVISYGFACKDYGFLENANPGGIEIVDAEKEAQETLLKIVKQIEKLTDGR
jgi:hypothetical protein